MSRYMTYLWQDQLAEPEYVKYGEHFIKGDYSLEECIQRTNQYIRKSLGPNKNRFDEGWVVVHRVWDCSEYARKAGIFRMHSHVDDLIRDKALVCRVEGTEKHRMTPGAAMSAVTKELDSEHTHRYYHTPAKGGRWWWGSEEHPNAREPKILVSLSGKYEPVVDAAGFKCKIIDSGDQFRVFRGGDTLKQGSHFWVKFTVESNIIPVSNPSK